MVKKEMRIFGIRIGWSHSGSKRRKKVTSKLERIANAALLDAVLRDPEVLATVIDKYGEIQVRHDDEMETEIQNFRATIYKGVEQTMRNERSHELASLIDDITDRVIHGGIDHADQHHKEKRPEGVIVPGENDIPATYRQHRRLQRDMKYNSNPPAILEDLELLAALATLAKWHIRRKARGRSENMNGVEHSGYAGEMSENGYERYSRRPQRLKKHESIRPPSSMAGQPELPGIGKPSPAQQNRNEYRPFGFGFGKNRR